MPLLPRPERHLRIIAVSAGWRSCSKVRRAGPGFRRENEKEANAMSRPRFRRILLKLSGEALMGSNPFGIDPDAVARVAGEVAAAKAAGHELCLVVGAGNIFRGLAAAGQGFDRTSADYMG